MLMKFLHSFNIVLTTFALTLMSNLVLVWDCCSVTKLEDRREILLEIVTAKPQTDICVTRAQVEPAMIEYSLNVHILC